MKIAFDQLISIQLASIRAEEGAPFPLFLWLERNGRAVSLRNIDAPLGSELAEKLANQGIDKLYLPLNFQDALDRYLDPLRKVPELARSPEVKLSLVPSPNNLDESTIVQESSTKPPLPAPHPLEKILPEQTVMPEELALLKEVVEDTFMTAEEKAEVLSAIGQDVLRSLNQIAERGDEPRRKGMLRCKQLADEILDIAFQNKSIYDEIIALRASQGDLDHSMMVGTVSVMFGLAIGISDKQTLGDITVSGLFHDVGLVKVDPKITSRAENTWTGPERMEYETHIEKSLQLLKETQGDFSDNVFRMIKEHHENFDSSGFPSGLSGSNLFECSQILHLGNLFDKLCIGRVDGQTYSPQEALSRLAAIATNSDAIQEIDPKLISRVFRLIMQDAGAKAKITQEIQESSKKTALKAILG